MTAFPQYKLSDLEDMPQEEYFRILAMAEWSMQVLRGIDITLEHLEQEEEGPKGYPEHPGSLGS